MSIIAQLFLAGPRLCAMGRVLPSNVADPGFKPGDEVAPFNNFAEDVSGDLAMWGADLLVMLLRALQALSYP